MADPETSVRRACASHPALTDDQRRRLLHDPEKRVRLRAVRYLPVTAAWVKELRNAKEEELVAWAVQHEGDEVVSSDPGVAMNAGDWKKDLADERPAVRVAALGKAPRGELFPYLHEHQSQFAKDPSADVRRALAMASRDAATLEVLGKDADKYVRRFALDNLSAPPALLIQEHAASPPHLRIRGTLPRTNTSTTRARFKICSITPASRRRPCASSRRFIRVSGAWSRVVTCLWMSSSNAP
ncbi:hypothetical protein [Verrucomicrobium spinosum]|uniref:hypothetical protein n=1 Tax=Verrucomicrobium spinosum TaxID=2736 RepID=UPI0012E23F1C|nr:hypothetical protein [Verrucomicrobium spinosum]